MNFEESTCWLKTKSSCSYKGNCDCGHPGELPSPTGTCDGRVPGPPAHPINSSKILLYNVEDDTGEHLEMSAAKVRKTPSWPRSGANFSLLLLRSHLGMHGPTYIFWANLTPFSPKPDVVAELHARVREHQKTAIPQATPETQGTTKCGPAVASQDNSTKGQGRMYWGPWC